MGNFGGGKKQNNNMNNRNRSFGGKSNFGGGGIGMGSQVNPWLSQSSNNPLGGSEGVSPPINKLNWRWLVLS